MIDCFGIDLGENCQVCARLQWVSQASGLEHWLV